MVSASRFSRNILATFQRTTMAVTRFAGKVRIMRRISVLILIVAILSLNARSNSGAEKVEENAERMPEEKNRTAAPESKVEKEEYAVYSDLIDIFFIQKGGLGSNPNPKVLVIVNETTIDSRVKPVWTNSEISIYDVNLEGFRRIKLEDSLIADFEKKDALGPKKLMDQFSLDVPVVLVSKGEIDQIFGEWDDFYKRFPDSQGYMTLSRVGFNSDRTKALIYMDNGCGVLCARGCYFLLHKEYGDWFITEEFDCWMS